MNSLKPESLSWTVLLARWMDFARASVAFPKTAEGDAWRASVAPVIDLQAVTFALGDIECVKEAERPVAIDKAEIIINRAAEALHDAWSGEDELPENLREVLNDARLALSVTRAAQQADSR